MLIAKRLSMFFRREGFEYIQSFRKIPGKNLWECVGNDGRSFLSEQVYKRITRQSPKKVLTGLEKAERDTIRTAPVG